MHPTHKKLMACSVISLLSIVALVSIASSSQSSTEGGNKPGWKEGVGWGWIWGKDDEVGALNAMTPASRLAALSLVKEGKVWDLGVRYDRNSFKWPGHSPGEVMTFRSPEGVKRQQDVEVMKPSVNPSGQAWHS